jgi:hypothetical protein
MADAPRPEPGSDALLAGYWPGTWPAEDGGPARRQVSRDASARLDVGPEDQLRVTHRMAMVTCMVITRDSREVYAVGHTGQRTDTLAWVERIDAESLATVRRSPDLASGPFWPGGIAAHRNGDLYATYGRWCHRLDPDCQPVASRMLPRERPYNSLLILPDGHLVMKDFGGGAGANALPAGMRGSELVVLEPERLEIVARLQLPEGSIARISADVQDGNARIYIVGDTHAFRVAWDSARTALTLDDGWTARYRVFDGQTFGWDPVIEDGYAWFLDNGEATETFGPSFRGKGVSSAPLHLVRIPLDTGGKPEYFEVCGEPGGIVANPPVIDATRKLAVGYDSGHGVVTAWRYDGDGAQVLWRRDQHQAGHMLLFPASGEIVCHDYDHERSSDNCVVLDIETGAEKARVATGSPVQSVVFPAVGWDRGFYVTSLTTIARIWVEPK